MKIFILLSMIFLGIVDDFYLQKDLVHFKTEYWWKSNLKPYVSKERWKKYKDDYKLALCIHSFSWTFMMMLPTAIYAFAFDKYWYPLMYLPNIFVHYLVDDAKANKMVINFTQDQLLHLIQVVITWILIYYVY